MRFGTMYREPKLIGEIGCNHQGDLSTAFQMVDKLATYCDADIAKFQKRTPKVLLSPEQYNAPHPNPRNSFGETYGEHREKLELCLEDHRVLKKYCEELSIQYSCSVWDLPSAEDICSLDPNHIKIPSAQNTNEELIKYVYEHSRAIVHISMGMTTEEERKKLLGLIIEMSESPGTVLYECTSEYPVPFEHMYLLNLYRIPTYLEAGYSGHHLGIAADVAALALGARWIERHFTLDRTWKGTDQAASLEPDAMRKLKRDLHNVSRALRYRGGKMSKDELEQRKKLKYRSGE